MADDPETVAAELLADEAAFAELTAAGVLDELAASACRHRVLVTLTFAPYDDPADD